MQKLIIALKAVAMVTLALLAISDAFAHDYGHVAVDLLAEVLLGRA